MCAHLRKQVPILAILLMACTFAAASLGAEVSSASGGILPGERSAQSNATPIWRAPTPTPPPPTLAPSLAQRYVPVAREFNHPGVRPVSDGLYSAKTLLSEPGRFDGQQVELRGKVITTNSIRQLLPDDWPVAYAVVVDDGSAWLPVLYRGDVGALEPGTQVRVTGVFVAAGPALHADLIAALTPATRWYNTIPQGMLPGLVVVCLLGLGALAVIVGRQALRLLAVCLVFLGGMTACQLHFETVVHPNGSATSSVHLSEKLESIDFLRRIPGMRRYISSWLAELRKQGLAVENWVAADTEYLVLQQRYSDLASLSALEDPSAQDSWVYATSYQVGDVEYFRYLARVDPRKLYTIPPGTEALVAEEMRKFVSQIELTYAVTLPGRIVYSNATKASGGRAEWRLDMGRVHEIVVESLRTTASPRPEWGWGWLAVAGGGVIDMGLWILALRRRRPRQRRP